MKVTKTVKYQPLGKTIKEPAGGTNCLAAGWGKTSNTAKRMSNVLMSVNVTVVDRVKCNSPEYYNLNPVITRSMICAGSDGKNRADTCQVRTLDSLSPPYQHLHCSVCVRLKMTCHVFILSPGRFRRAAVVQWNADRGDLFRTEVWRDEKSGSVLFSLRKTTHLDQNDNEEV